MVPVNNIMQPVETVHPAMNIHNKNYADLSKPSAYGCISGERKYHDLLLSVFQLRHRVFKERLQWDVSSINGHEIDKFDIHDTKYIITTDTESNVKGCVRILPTTSPYMLSEIFPFLWQSESPIPCSASIYELSRFAFEKEQSVKGYGFSSSVIKLLRNLILYAKDKKIEQFIFVTTTIIERMLKIQGISIERIGSEISMRNAKTVVTIMNINSQTEKSIFG
ncbi:Acyl-homoserine-lactone synthase [Buttiauxella agrestis]|uniref:Acyl-homoserine-lactone synthase n=2 Tax=Buttiauxella agrestis TaxID=82977 RepID=A0A381KQI9_9ENTR|nr:Acyl-homoserine-lactone synthase [Buttiauxella agrestis]